MLLCSVLTALRMCAPAPTTTSLPVVGGATRKADESLMAQKAHGTTDKAVQAELRWDVNRETADAICSFNRDGAEPNMYFTECLEFTRELGWQRGKDMSKIEPIVFYDSVSSLPLFVAPMERTVEDFLSESLRHGWPSFRQSEVCWSNVRVIDSTEVVSTSGTHLGHVFHDDQGARFCINLCSVAGQPGEAPSGGVQQDEDEEEEDDDWPLLNEISSYPVWSGSMHYATGEDGLGPAPFVLSGTMGVTLSDERICRIRSTVVLPNGAERVVCMEGPLGDAGTTARLERVADGEDGKALGPISLLMTEHPAAKTILMREVNSTSGETLITSSLVIVPAATEAEPPELVQTAHELSPPGVQMWRMRPGAVGTPLGVLGDQDEEMFMVSGSEL